MKAKREGELVSNRKAFHNYEILDTWEAGIVLQGTEIKSLRDHGGSLQDAYILVSDQHAILKGASISPYKHGSVYNHPERRDRKLLLHKREMLKLREISQEKGLTLIPLAIYLKNGYAKVKVASVRGKKDYDKRASMKEREHKRTIDRAIKGD